MTVKKSNNNHLQHPFCLVELFSGGADVDNHHKAAVAVKHVLEQVSDLVLAVGGR